MGYWRSIALAALAAGSIACGALAQDAQPPAGPTPEKSASERFKDWELFCPQPKPKDKPRICEVRTIISGKEGARLGALAIALNPEPGARDLPMIATVLLPLGVELALAPTLTVGESKPLPLQFRRCLQRGCEAVALIEADYLKALRGGTVAKVAVGIGGGKNAVFEFSLAGFTAAHDAIKQRVGKS